MTRRTAVDDDAPARVHVDLLDLDVVGLDVAKLLENKLIIKKGAIEAGISGGSAAGTAAGILPRPAVWSTPEKLRTEMAKRERPFQLT